MVREFMASNDITQDDLHTLLVDNGWTKAEWDTGAKLSANAIQDKIRLVVGEYTRSILLRLPITSYYS